MHAGLAVADVRVLEGHGKHVLEPVGELVAQARAARVPLEAFREGDHQRRPLTRLVAEAVLDLQLVRLLEDGEAQGLVLGGIQVDVGAFVEILPGTEGLLHISQISKERVNKVTDVLREGDEVMVKVLEMDKQGKIRLSRKEALGENGQ